MSSEHTTGHDPSAAETSTPHFGVIDGGKTDGTHWRREYTGRPTPLDVEGVATPALRLVGPDERAPTPSLDDEAAETLAAGLHASSGVPPPVSREYRFRPQTLEDKSDRQLEIIVEGAWERLRIIKRGVTLPTEVENEKPRTRPLAEHEQKGIFAEARKLIEATEIMSRRHPDPEEEAPEIQIVGATEDIQREVRRMFPSVDAMLGKRTKAISGSIDDIHRIVTRVWSSKVWDGRQLGDADIASLNIYGDDIRNELEKLGDATVLVNPFLMGMVRGRLEDVRVLRDNHTARQAEQKRRAEEKRIGPAEADPEILYAYVDESPRAARWKDRAMTVGAAALVGLVAYAARDRLARGGDEAGVHELSSRVVPVSEVVETEPDLALPEPSMSSARPTLRVNADLTSEIEHTTDVPSSSDSRRAIRSFFSKLRRQEHPNDSGKPVLRVDLSDLTEAASK